MITETIDTFETVANYTAVFLIFPFFIGLVFFVHELGHYMAARIFKTDIEKFSIGIGRTVWERKDRRGTLWTLSLIPLGGHVIINNKAGHPDSFRDKKTWQKSLIIAAGPFINILFSILILTFSASAIGVPSIPPYVSGVELGSPADKAGFEPHDKVLEFNGRPVVDYREVIDVTEKITGKPFRFLVERDGKEMEFEVLSEVVPYKNKDLLPREKGMIGISVKHEGLSLSSINEINGIDVSDDKDKAREVIKGFLDHNVILNIGFYGQNSKYYHFRPLQAHNDTLFLPDSYEYDKLFPGVVKGNFLRRLPVPEALGHGFGQTKRISYGFFYIIGQVFRGQVLVPDIEKIVPGISIQHQKHYHQIISLLYLTAMVSVLLALFNLLPVPFFDGGQLIRVLIHGHRERKQKKKKTLSAQ